MSAPEYVASACLAGLDCRYDGASRPCAPVVKLFKAGKLLPICPETLSGMEKPRLPCEWQQDRIIDKSGRDRTESFQKGAELALQAALASGCRKAILKSKSPSCGVGEIYDGSFSGGLRSGNGIWADKLAAAGFELYSEKNLPEDLTEEAD